MQASHIGKIRERGEHVDVALTSCRRRAAREFSERAKPTMSATPTAIPSTSPTQNPIPLPLLLLLLYRKLTTTTTTSSTTIGGASGAGHSESEAPRRLLSRRGLRPGEATRPMPARDGTARDGMDYKWCFAAAAARGERV